MVCEIGVMMIFNGVGRSGGNMNEPICEIGSEESCIDMQVIYRRLRSRKEETKYGGMNVH